LDENLQAVFVHGETEGKVWVAGSVNWAKEGRHFLLSLCNLQTETETETETEEDCYSWTERDPAHW
jgi:hypothetical protein